MDILLDTHILLWTFLNDPRLKAKQRLVLQSQENRLFVSAVSAFEIATKVRIGKLKAAAGLSDRFADVLAQFSYQSLPVTARHALRGGFLPGTHRDPFDRLLAAQSIEEGLPLMTNDSAISALGATTIW